MVPVVVRYSADALSFFELALRGLLHNAADLKSRSVEAV